MKKRLLFQSAILLITFIAASGDCCRVFAQGGDAKLTPAPKPTTAPKSDSKAGRPSAPVSNVLVFDEDMKGRLDARGSEKAANGVFFEEFVLNAKSEDLLVFQLQSADVNLGLQIVDKDNADVPLAKDATTGDFGLKTTSGGLPGDGEYRVRVTGSVSGRNSTPFSLKVNRKGLTVNVYNDRLTQIYSNYRENDPASVDETLAKLEELTKDDGYKSGAFELLGIIYLYNKRDFEKAETAMEQAIKLNGAAVVKITFDAQWRRMTRQRNGKFDWQESRQGWVRIRPGQLILTDPGNRTLATVAGSQIREISKILTATRNLVTVTGENARRQFIFEPGSGEQAEADLVIKLIQNHVMGKTN